MAELTLEALRGELAPIRAELEAMRADLTPIQARIDGTNVTAGEITALHDDLNRALAANTELEARIITLERLVRELQQS